MLVAQTSSLNPLTLKVWGLGSKNGEVFENNENLFKNKNFDTNIIKFGQVSPKIS